MSESLAVSGTSLLALPDELVTPASSASASGHVVISANANWLVAPKYDASRIMQLWESMLSASTNSGRGGMQVGRNSALPLVGLNRERVARQKINLTSKAAVSGVDRLKLQPKQDEVKMMQLKWWPIHLGIMIITPQLCYMNPC